MYKRIKRHKLGREKSHRDSLVKNLLRSLFDKNYVVTTTAKAKVLKQEAMSLIETGKKKSNNLSFQRKLKIIFGKDQLIKKYSDYLKKEKAGVGFVRVGFRDGDNAEISRVFLLGLDKKKSKVVKESKKEKEKAEKKVPVRQKGEKIIEPKKEVDKTAVIKRDETRPRARAGL